MTKNVASFLLVISIIGIPLLAYKDITTLFFTSGDSITLIETGQIRSVRDVTRILSEPMMNGTTFVSTGRFYRPLSVMSYSFNNYMAGVNPYFYHITDLCAHIIVSVLAYFVVKSLTGNAAAAWLSAIIFAIHPVTAEVVPSTGRRQDILATLFMLAALLVLLRREPVRRGQLLISAFLSGLAMLCKETAVVYPVVAYAYWYLSGNKQVSGSVARPFRRSLPFVAVALVLIGWRTWVLGGLGGYHGTTTRPEEVILLSIDIMADYFSDLVYPLGPALGRLSLGWSFTPLWSLVTITILVLIVWRWRHTLFDIFRRFASRTERLSAVILLVISITAAVVFVTYPLWSSLISRLIHSLHQVSTSDTLSSAMAGRGKIPVGAYIMALEKLIMLTSIYLLVIGVAGLVWLYKRQGIASFVEKSPCGRTAALAGIWLVLPLFVFLASRTFSHRSMYFSAFAFSVTLSCLMIESVAAIRENRSRKRLGWMLSSIATVSIWIFLFINSPLIIGNSEWRDNASLSAMLMKNMVTITKDLPQETQLQVIGYPRRILSPRGKLAAVREVSCCGSDYAIKSWLKLHYPNRRIEVTMQETVLLTGFPQTVALEVRREGANRLCVYVRCRRSN